MEGGDEGEEGVVGGFVGGCGGNVFGNIWVKDEGKE